MDKQFKIVKRTFIPQVIISILIILIFSGIVYLNNNHKSIDTLHIISLCIMITSFVFIIYPNVKTIGLLQFDLLGVTINVNNSTIRYNFLDDKLTSLRIKLKNSKNRRHILYLNNSSIIVMNKLEIFYNYKREIFRFKVDSSDDYKQLKEILTQINEKAKVILN
jgi:hypothetical protein